ncbi:MAG: histidine phosphatase family protein [Sulfuritalea sp.]|nr:histidine phosphatase family protein [Sulfuritalea sp.]
MDLILWRHAEAEEGGAQLPDAKRRLTARGDRQAQVMAKWLKARLPKKTRILVSPATRTQQTAHALALPFEVEPRIGVGVDAADLIAAAQWPEHSGAVLLVGHQPTLGRLVALLLSGAEADWSVKKGAVWWLSKRSREGRDQTVLRAVIPAEMLD